MMSPSGSGSGTDRSKMKRTMSKKSINFELCSVEIGQWKQVAEREGTIVGKCFFAKKELVWEFLPVSDQKKVRMVIRWTKIIAASYSELDGGNGLIEIELNEKPTFEEEKDVCSRHSSYNKAFDFTDDNASKYRRHRIEMAPHIISRYFLKLKEDDDTPLRKALENPFQYGPSSTFEAEIMIAAPEPMAQARTVHESARWFDHQQLRSELLPVIQPPNTAQGSTSQFYHSFQPQLTEFPGLRNQELVYMAKRVKLEDTIIPPRNLVHETMQRSDSLLQPQQTEDFCSWSRGSILPQQTRLEATIPSAIHGTTNRLCPPFQLRQAEELGSWTPRSFLPYQTKPEPTIPSVVYESIYRFGPPFHSQQTGESSSWPQRPVLTHQTKPEPTIPNAIYGTTFGFNLPFQPQQTGESSSWTPGTVLPHQTKPEPTIPNVVYGTTYGVDPPFQPQQTGESSSRTPGPVLYHQTKHEPTIPNAFYGTTYGLNPPFQLQQIGESSSWTPGPVLHHHSKPEPTIPNAFYGTTYGFNPPFQPQQTGESSSWNPGPVLPHQTKLEPTIPKAVYGTTYGLDHPFQPQQAEESSSWTSEPVLPHQTKPEPTLHNVVYETIHGLDLPFQPQQTEVSASWTQEPVPTTNMVQHMANWSDFPVYTPQTAVPSSSTQGPSTSQPGFNLPLSVPYQYQNPTRPGTTISTRQLRHPSMTFQEPSDRKSTDQPV